MLLTRVFPPSSPMASDESEVKGEGGGGRGDGQGGGGESLANQKQILDSQRPSLIGTKFNYFG